MNTFSINKRRKVSIMEIKMQIGYEQLIEIIRQLPLQDVKRLVKDVKIITESSKDNYNPKVIESAQQMEKGEYQTLSLDEAYNIVHQ